jgi:hypothetical protein
MLALKELHYKNDIICRARKNKIKMGLLTQHQLRNLPHRVRQHRMGPRKLNQRWVRYTGDHSGINKKADNAAWYARNIQQPSWFLTVVQSFKTKDVVNADFAKH